MSAGSLTLGGNLSVAIGPLGRNGEASGSLNTSGKVAAMYSYSKTRGLFGGVSIEGSVIVERQDANAQAYHADVSAKQLLSGAIPPPEWASPLIKTLESCTGLPGGRRWVEELHSNRPRDPYMFGSMESPGNEGSPSGSRYFPESPSTSNSKLSKKNKSKASSISFPPVNWGRRKSSGSYFSEFHEPERAPRPADAGTSTPSPNLSPEDRPSPRLGRALNPATGFFETKFQSDYVSEDQLRQHPPLGRRDTPPVAKPPTSQEERWEPGSPFNDLPPFNQARSNMSDATSHRRAFSAYAPSSSSGSRNPFDAQTRDANGFGEDEDLLGLGDVAGGRGAGSSTLGRNSSLSSGKPKLAPKAELTRPLLPHEGVARAIALFDFKAVQVRVSKCVSGVVARVLITICGLLLRSRATCRSRRGRLSRSRRRARTRIRGGGAGWMAPRGYFRLTLWRSFEDHAGKRVCCSARVVACGIRRRASVILRLVVSIARRLSA